MRVIISIAFVILAWFGSIAQDSTIALNQPTKADYLHKSKSNKTAGWILVTAGTAGLFGTALSDLGESVRDDATTVFSLGLVQPEPKRSYTVPYLISLGVGLASIPFFTAAARNKRLANNMTSSFKVEKAELLANGKTSTVQFAAIGIKMTW
jgi:hypothetical protein